MLVDNQEKKLPKTVNHLQDEFVKFFSDKIENIHM